MSPQVKKKKKKGNNLNRLSSVQNLKVLYIMLEHSFSLVFTESRPIFP